VSSAADGAQAREQVRAALPDLVILDLMLPVVSGFGLIDEWRKDPSTAALPIFVLTNKDLTEVERNYLSINTGALFSKHEQWRDELIRQIERVQRPAPLLAEAQ
jgi:DNA-binding response OmpR family regulator